MEMQFDRIPVPYLQKLTGSVRTQEETLEVRLPEGMPDIGRVLGAWGQVVVRGKEWNSDHMALSCGVMAWVLYTPEDGEGVRSVEAWLPFSMKWELPETRYDGKILAKCMLKNIDARSTSARKLMVRAVLCADAQAWQTAQAEIATPGELPGDIQLLTESYPVMLPREMGEKPFLLEEQLSVSNAPKPDKLMYYTLQPEITEQKIMAERIVFRGTANLHLLYRGEDERLYTWDWELPFSQYADLDGAFGPDAEMSVQMCVTSLDLSLDENGQLQMKAGLLGQYLLSDRSMVTVAEDAYSPNRKLELMFEQLQLPSVLDRITNSLQAEANVQADAQQLVDTVFYPACGQIERAASDAKILLPGQFQMLYYDAEGELRSAVAHWEDVWNVQTAEDSHLNTRIIATGKPQAMLGAGNVALRSDMIAEATVTSGQGIPMLTGMEIGEAEKPDPNRPSLILCRKGNRRIWDVAKQTGSTMDTIMQANGLDAEPESSRVLLIPVK